MKIYEAPKRFEYKFVKKKTSFFDENSELQWKLGHA